MGLLWAALGGAAEAGLDTIKNNEKERRDVRMASIQEDLIAKRAQTVADIQEKIRAAKEARQVDQYDQIDTQAAQNGLQRDATSMTRGAAGLPSEGEFAGQSVKPEDIANLPPAARLAYERSGLINRPSTSRLTLDKVDAARSIGADAEVRKELRDQYGSEVKDERIAAEKNSTLEETRRHNQATEVNGALTAGAAVTRAGAAATAAGSKQPKPLAGAVLKQLTEARDTANTIANLSASFKDDFAGKGVFGIGADAQMGASANLGADKDSVAWWKDYRKQAELVERHSMFGASLTPGEQASWRSADIGPGMDKDVIKTNLATRAALTKRMFENTRQDFIDAGHSEERVSAIAGRSSQHVADAPPKSPPAPKAGEVDNGYRFKGGNAADPKNWTKI